MSTVPARRRSVLRLPLSRLHAGDTLRSVRLDHLVEKDGELVCGPGLEALPKDYPDGGFELYAVENEVFLHYRRENDAEGKGPLFPVFCKYQGWTGNAVETILDATIYQHENSFTTWLVITKNGAYYYRSYNPPLIFDETKYHAEHCAAYAERTFAVSKSLILHSGILGNTSWQINPRNYRDRFGYVEMPLYHGEYVGCAAFGGHLYVFSRQGIMRLTMGGDTLAARIEDIPYGSGIITDGSVVCCGDRAAFVSDRGLFVFDGKTCKQLPACCLKLLDLSQPFTASHSAGVYYLHGHFKDGSRALYAYDIGKERESFLHLGAESFSARLGAYALKKGIVYRMTERGMPADGSALSLTFTLPEGARDYLRAEWIRISGEGEFSVTAAGRYGHVAHAEGGAGKRLRLSKDIGGDLTFTVSTRDEDAHIAEVEVGLGEEERYDD